MLLEKRKDGDHSSAASGMRPYGARLLVLHDLIKGNSHAVEGETQTLGPDRIHLSLASRNFLRRFGDPLSPRLRVNHRSEIEKDDEYTSLRLFLCGDVMTGGGID